MAIEHDGIWLNLYAAIKIIAFSPYGVLLNSYVVIFIHVWRDMSLLVSEDAVDASLIVPKSSWAENTLNPSTSSIYHGSCTKHPCSCQFILLFLYLSIHLASCSL